MLQNDSHLNCLCVMARLIEALAIYQILGLPPDQVVILLQVQHWPPVNIQAKTNNPIYE